MTKRIFGNLPGVAEGDEFESRKALHDAKVHAPTQAGISGSGHEGADSIVLSGGYEDDYYEGNIIIYTGQGGRDANSGRQVAHQLLTLGNLALALNHQEGLPVRVTRGHQHRSPFSPKTGYKYGGLYRVEDHWHEVGKSGYRVWRYRLVKVGTEMQAPESETEKADSQKTARRQIITQRIVRDTAKARAVKVPHNFTCQMCGVRLEGPAGPYAEAAHIRPLGSPHDGPDVESNILCLCPNHHVLFDLGAVAVEDDLSLISLPGLLRTTPKHSIDLQHVRYHRERYLSDF